MFSLINLFTLQHDTCRHLDWLKNVKESHGSVEVNAISQAKAINARGIYHVGKRKGLEPEVGSCTISTFRACKKEGGQ